MTALFSNPISRLATWTLVALWAVGCGRDRPNVLLLSLDTTRADHLGAYGYAQAKTPAIDALAAQGFRFERHLTPVPITLPAHTSLFTGLFPPTHTVHDNGTFYVPPSSLTLAEVLAAEGYDTAAFVGSFPLERRFGLDQGFAHYDDRFYASESDRQRRENPGLFFDERPAGAVVDAALAHLGRPGQSAGQPFFAWLHFFDPHQPQAPPSPFDLEFRERPYDGEIAYVDSQLARLFAELKKRGQWDNTLVILTADHGEGLGEHGELTHAILLHQATLHIPLILAGPGVPVGTTRNWTIATEVFDTVLDLVGAEAETGPIARGPSLHPMLENGGAPRPQGDPFTAYFETIAPRTSQGWSQLTAAMRQDLRYVHSPRPELYDLDADPHETTNLIAAQPEAAARLLVELRRFLKATETRTVGDAAGAIDPETVARLAALGYLQSSLDDLRQVDDLLAVEGLTDPKDRVIDINLFSEAKAAMSKGRWQLAESLWAEVLRRSPESVFAYRGLAVLAAMSHDWAKSQAVLDEGLARVPSSADLKRLKGQLLVESGRFAEGLAVLQTMKADSVEAYTWLGVAFQGVGDSERAKEAWRAGLKLDAKSSWLRLYLGNRLAVEGAFAEAEPFYQGLLADHPYFPLGWYNYGRMLIDAGRLAEARPLLTRAAELAPQHAPTQAALAHLAELAPAPEEPREPGASP